MKIFTSYYSNFARIPSDLLCIGISRYIPDEFKTTKIHNFLYTPNSILAPSRELLMKIKNGEIGQDEYAKIYFSEIGQSFIKLGYRDAREYFAKMFSDFEKSFSEKDGPLSSFNGIVFLCYEKPGDFCHRHLLAALMRSLGYDVSEYEKRKLASKNDTISNELF